MTRGGEQTGGSPSPSAPPSILGSHILVGGIEHKFMGQKTLKTSGMGAPTVAQWVKNLTAVAWVAGEVQVPSPAWRHGLKDLAWPGNSICCGVVPKRKTKEKERSGALKGCGRQESGSGTRCCSGAKKGVGQPFLEEVSW